MMGTEDRVMRYPFLMAGGLSGLGARLAEELIGNASVNEMGFKWDRIFTIMLRETGSHPEVLPICHMMCASRAPSTYCNLTALVINHALSVYESGMQFNPFCQYSIIGVLKAGVLLQVGHQCLIGNQFEESLVTFIQSTILSNCRTPSWSTEEREGKGTLQLMDEVMKSYFRPTDQVARRELKCRMPRILLCLNQKRNKHGKAANEALQSKEIMLGPGAAMLKSLIFALLDYEHRNYTEILAMLGVLNPLTESHS